MIKGKKCELIELYYLLGKKWTIELFHYIKDEPISFNELRRLTCDIISPILLSRRLKEMINFKLIKKRNLNKRIVYEITNEGKEMKDIMHNLKRWAVKNDYELPSFCKKGKCHCDYVFGRTDEK